MPALCPRLAFALALGFAVGAAHAQEPPAAAPDAAAAAEPEAPTLSAPEQAAKFFNEGRELFRDKQFRAASDKFRAAYNLDPSPILLYNLARAAEETPDPERAVEHYQNYLNAVGPDAEDRDEVERRIRVMEKTLIAARRAKVRIVGMPQGAEIKVDGAVATLEDGLVRPDSGSRTIVVRAAGTPPWSRTILLRNGQYVELQYGEAEAKVPERGISTRALAGYITAGSGAALLIAGGVFHVKANASADEYADHQDTIRTLDIDDPRLFELNAAVDGARDDYESSRTAAYLLYGVGGAALATGATLLVLEWLDGPTTTALVPTPGGIGLTGTF